MWPLHNKKIDWLAVVLYQNHCLLGWLQSDYQKHLKIKDVKKISFDEFYIENGVVFNNTYIKKCINDYIWNYSLQNPHVILGLQTGALIEEIIDISSGTVDEYVLQNKAKMICSCCQISDNTEGEKWYISAIARENLFQYKLLVQGLPIVAILPLNKAYLHLLACKQNMQNDVQEIQQISDIYAHAQECDMADWLTDSLHNCDVTDVAGIVGLSIAGEQI